MNFSKEIADSSIDKTSSFIPFQILPFINSYSMLILVPVLTEIILANKEFFGTVRQAFLLSQRKAESS
jgi:hypothetical protein